MDDHRHLICETTFSKQERLGKKTDHSQRLKSLSSFHGTRLLLLPSFNQNISLSPCFIFLLSVCPGGKPAATVSGQPVACGSRPVHLPAQEATNLTRTGRPRHIYVLEKLTLDAAASSPTNVDNHDPPLPSRECPEALPAIVTLQILFKSRHH